MRSSEHSARARSFGRGSISESLGVLLSRSSKSGERDFLLQEELSFSKGGFEIARPGRHHIGGSVFGNGYDVQCLLSMCVCKHSLGKLRFVTLK